MEKYFALIKDGLVKEVIVASDDFIPLIQDQYDHIIDVTGKSRPSVGDSYYSNTEEFIQNNLDTIVLPVIDEDADYLNEGTEDGFEPFQISKYSVSYKDGFIQIGCKKYSAPGFLEALHKTLVEKEEAIECFNTVDGPAHGKFGITWEDAQKLYDALRKVKL